MIENLMWGVTVASLVGTVANIKKKRWCFGVWLVTNLSWMSYDFYIGAYSQATLFAIYAGLAVYGIYEWKR